MNTIKKLLKENEKFIVRSEFKIIRPQLATLTAEPPKGNNYLHELKYDGYRIMVYIQNKKVRIITRGGFDWTAKFPHLKKSLEKLKLENAIFDGEIVVFNKKGKPDFQLLQNEVNRKNDSNIVYYIFDLLHYEDSKLCRVPLITRKAILEKVLNSCSDNLVYCMHIVGDGNKLYELAIKNKFEGIVSKKIDSPYISARSKYWFKCKNYNIEKFLLAGFYAKNDRVVSFLLAKKFKNTYRYCGKVNADYYEINKTRFETLISKYITNDPFIKIKNLKSVSWLIPNIEVKVKYTEKTEDGLLRQAIFID